MWQYVCNKKVTILCFVKFVALVLFQCQKKKQKKNKKKNDIKRLDPEVSIISSKNEGEVPVEQYYTLDKFLFSAG